MMVVMVMVMVMMMAMMMMMICGCRYVGLMKEGQHEGQGTMYYHNGDTYAGDA